MPGKLLHNDSGKAKYVVVSCENNIFNILTPLKILGINKHCYSQNSINNPNLLNSSTLEGLTWAGIYYSDFFFFQNVKN